MKGDLLDMRIVFIRSNPVNPDPRVEKEVNSLLKKGFEIEILAWDRNTHFRQKESFLKLENGEAKVYRFGIPATYGGGIQKNFWALAKFQISIFQWLLKNKSRYEAIHACDFDTAFISSKAARLLNKVFIYDIFDFYVDSFRVPDKMKKYVLKQEHLVINRADAVILCTDKRREQIKGSNPKQIAVIHNTPSQSDTPIQTIRLNQNKTKIVYVGILGEERLIKEIVELVKTKPEYEFHVGGFGEYEQFLMEAAKENDNIFFYGRLPYHKTLELENSCDIMTAIYDPDVINHYYAAPNKFYEALMLGKPLIMVKNTGMDDILVEHDIGVVTEYNVRAIEEGLEKLVERKDEWPSMSERMKNLYCNSYSWTTMERRLFDLYDGIKAEKLNIVETNKPTFNKSKEG